MKKVIAFFLCTVSVFLWYSCGEDTKPGEAGYENEMRGTVEILCDECIFPLIASVKPTYDSAFPDAHVTLKSVSTREAIEGLLTGKAKGVILGRDFLPNEDSLIKQYGLHLPDKYALAFDAVVFTALKNSDAPDTVNLLDVKKYFTGEIELNPFGNGTVYYPGVNSAPYSHFLRYVTDGSAPKRVLKNAGSSDSVLLLTKQNKGIGISLLSRTIKDSSLKNIRIGFYDSTGRHIAPHLVHQANIVQDKYPLEMPIVAVLQQNRPKLAYGFFTYLSKEAKIQRQFKEAGIVPGFATIHLIQD